MQHVEYSEINHSKTKESAFMAFDLTKQKHCAMRDLLIVLGVEDPERDYFYSTGSTVTESAITAALQAATDYKSSVQQLAQNIIELH